MRGFKKSFREEDDCKDIFFSPQFMFLGQHNHCSPTISWHKLPGKHHLPAFLDEIHRRWRCVGYNKIWTLDNPKDRREHHPLCSSISNGAQHVTRNWFFLHQICAACGGWYKAQRSCAPPNKNSVINCTWLRLSICDLSISAIGPGGLLLVVPMYMHFHFQFYWRGCQKWNSQT